MTSLRGRWAPLLDLDPDLAVALDRDRLRTARRELLVALRRIDVGAWRPPDRVESGTPASGLLIADGVIVRDVLMEDNVSSELLGPGDLVRPARADPPARLLRHEVRWAVLAETQVGVLDSRITTALTRYPEIQDALLDRVDQRADRAAVTRAMTQLKRVDHRLLAFFWQLAERWGHVTPAGVAIPLALSHRMLAELVGARRPTVSTAVGELARRHELQRRDDGSWLLTGEPVGAAHAEIRELVPVRRRLMT